MNASDLIRIHRNRTLFFFNQYQQQNGPSLGKPSSPELITDILIGGQPSIFQYRQMDAIPETFTTLQTGDYFLQKSVVLSVELLLKYAAQINLGPTRTSRLFYLWFFTLTAGYNWASSDQLIFGIKDSWNWDERFTLADENEKLLWMNRLIIELLPIFISGIGTDLFVAMEDACFHWDPETHQAKIDKSRSDGNWTLFRQRWDTWKAYRDSDGNVAASAVPPNSVLPNGSQTLTVTTTTDNPNDFTDPNKWVPLVVLGLKRNYLTYGWGDVLSSCLTSSDSTEVLDNAQTFFPGNATSSTDDSARALEIQEVVDITGTLTDEQKCIAELWAGGPFTVSPPGMFIWLWKETVKCTILGKKQETAKCILSGFDLAIHLFETGRLIWQLKKDNMQARPIQEIRRMYRGTSLTKWDGTSVLGEAWTPYQETNFVTPPFPDFPSGHSGFSQSFANVMSDWFGSSVPTASVVLGDLNLLSPAFNGPDQSTSLGTFTFPAGQSQIQSGVVPSEDLVLSFSTWQAMADSAGISRKYGGIHATSAHTGSQALANDLHTKINTRWALPKNV